MIMGLCLALMSAALFFFPGTLQAKTIELTFSHTIPPVVPNAKVYQAWADQIAERSGGRVKINFYWSESLLKASEFFRGVQTGATDMTFYVVGIDSGLMPLNMGFKLAFMGYRNLSEGTEIYNKIFKKGTHTTGGSRISTTHKIQR